MRITRDEHGEMTWACPGHFSMFIISILHHGLNILAGPMCQGHNR